MNLRRKARVRNHIVARLHEGRVIVVRFERVGLRGTERKKAGIDVAPRHRKKTSDPAPK